MTTDEMDDICAVRYIDLPTTISAYVSFDIDGFASVYINARLSYHVQQRALHHEMEHIRRGDYDTALPIRAVEAI